MGVLNEMDKIWKYKKQLYVIQTKLSEESDRP